MTFYGSNSSASRDKTVFIASPAEVSDLVAWFDAADAGTVAKTTAGNVESWTDKVSGFVIAKHGTGNSNLSHTSSTRINTRQAMSSSGASGWPLTTTGSSLATMLNGENKQPITLLCAIRTGVSPVAGAAVHFRNTATLAGTPVFSLSAFGGDRLRIIARAQSSGAPSNNVDSFVSPNTPYIFTCRSTGTTVTARANGAQTGSANLNPQPYFPNLNQMCISGAVTSGTPGSATALWNGMLGEILVYSRALSEVETLSVERWLARRWAIALAYSP